MDNKEKKSNKGKIIQRGATPTLSGEARIISRFRRHDVNKFIPGNLVFSSNESRTNISNVKADQTRAYQGRREA